MQQAIQQEIRHYRSMLVFRGVIAVLFGIVIAIVWPQIALLTLVYLFGAYALVAGMVTVVAAFQGRAYRDGWVLLLEGVVGILAGGIAFIWPTITALVFLYLLAAWAIVTGVMEIVGAFLLPLGASREWLLGLAGLTSILFGIFIGLQPAAGLLSVVWMIGVYAIFVGILYLVRYFQIREEALA